MSRQFTRYGEWLRWQRLRRGWTCEMLEEEADITEGVARYERGERYPTAKRRIKIAKALGADGALGKEERDALHSLLRRVLEEAPRGGVDLHLLLDEIRDELAGPERPYGFTFMGEER